MKNTLEATIGNTPLAKIKRLSDKKGGEIYLKLEGNNPAGSVKDRPALSMIKHAEMRGEIKSGDTLIEATSGNTGIALAMVAAIRGYRMILVMPENMSVERRAVMKAFGAKIVLTSDAGSMEEAIDVSRELEAKGKGKILDQFANKDNPRSHYEGTGPELWGDTNGKITHFVSAMGTTGTIMGTSRFLKEKNPNIQIIGVQPEGANAYFLSRKAGKPITLSHWDTIADGLSARFPGAYPFHHLQEYLDDVVLVSEKEIAASFRSLLYRGKLLVEPAGAVAPAAFLSGKVDQDRITVAAVTGGNVTEETVQTLLSL